jgi:outer membrane protein OmpA-like peptidoglycan-associated protein
VVVHKAALERATTPLELLLGAHYRFGDFHVGAGAGAGLTRGVGSPEFRLVGLLEWSPRVESPAAVATVAAAGAASAEASSIQVDVDGDGIADRSDACPTVAGIASEDAGRTGCPAAKGEGVLENVGERDDHAEAASVVAGREPKVRNVLGQTVMEPIQFDLDSDVIRPDSEGRLQTVLGALREHPGAKISLDGHTDELGDAVYNHELSQRRAHSVARWLTRRGIAPERLIEVGHGTSYPVDDTQTPEGRARNRRVEFQVIEQGR